MDHVVVPSSDLSGLVRAFGELGFTIGGRNRHPWGTENHIVQFRSSFIELLGFADDFTAPAAAEPANPFAGFLAQWVAEGRRGAAMTVLRSSDAGADAVSFAADRIGTGRMLPFSRSAQAADGTDKTVAFTIAFAESETMPTIGFFSCEQHRPENFWNPAVQSHANHATNLAGFVIVADSPLEHVAFLQSFSGGTVSRSTADAVEIAAPGLRIGVVTADRFAAEYGVAPSIGSGGPRIAALLLSAPCLDRTAAFFDNAKIEVDRLEGRIVLRPEILGGRALIFEAPGPNR